MNKIILTSLLFLSLTIQCREVDVKITYTTNLKASGVHQLVITKNREVLLDGLQMDSALLPAIVQPLSTITHIVPEKVTKCFGGTYQHTVIIDKNKRVQKGCIEGTQFGKLDSAFKAIKRIQSKPPSSKS